MAVINKYELPNQPIFYRADQPMKDKPNSKDRKELAKIKKGYDKLSIAGKRKDIAMDKAALNRKSQGMNRGKK